MKFRLIRRDKMAKRLTKTQIKRLYNDILAKSKKLWSISDMTAQVGYHVGMNTVDYLAIEKIIHKYQKKMR